MRYTFQSVQWLPYPVELVFAFFAYPENLPRLMPRWQKARIEEAAFAPPPTRPIAPDPAMRFNSIAAGTGTRMTLSFKPFPYAPIRIPWEAEITEFVWNEHFCDRQLRGPFAHWHHCHRFHPTTRDESGIMVQGTVVRDQIEYEMHLGIVGEMVNAFHTARQIRNTFAYRQSRTAELLSRMAASLTTSTPASNHPKRPGAPAPVGM
jgi:ligand-binding SRPBCC domain-containing protein